MKVAKKYLDEIEQILDLKIRFGSKGRFSKAKNLDYALNQHWGNPMNYAGLFNPVTLQKPVVGFAGCLTQIRQHYRTTLQHDFSATGTDGSIHDELTKAVGTDKRLHKSPEKLAKALANKTREEQRAILMPYAEWQTKLDQMRRDHARQSKVS